jgi:hypothetical protein
MQDVSCGTIGESCGRFGNVALDCSMWNISRFFACFVDQPTTAEHGNFGLKGIVRIEPGVIPLSLS